MYSFLQQVANLLQTAELLDHFLMLPQVGFGKDHLDQSVNQQWAAYYKLQDRPFLQRVAKLLQTKLDP